MHFTDQVSTPKCLHNLWTAPYSPTLTAVSSWGLTGCCILQDKIKRNRDWDRNAFTSMQSDESFLDFGMNKTLLNNKSITCTLCCKCLGSLACL